MLSPLHRPRVTVSPSQAGPTRFDVFVDGFLRHSALPYDAALQQARLILAPLAGPAIHG